MSRIFSIQYDGWSNQFQDHFFGSDIAFIDHTERWKLKNIVLGTHPANST
jgi:hypothetical protein